MFKNCQHFLSGCQELPSPACVWLDPCCLQPRPVVHPTQPHHSVIVICSNPRCCIREEYFACASSVCFKSLFLLYHLLLNRFVQHHCRKQPCARRDTLSLSKHGQAMFLGCCQISKKTKTEYRKISCPKIKKWSKINTPWGSQLHKTFFPSKSIPIYALSGQCMYGNELAWEAKVDEEGSGKVVIRTNVL